VSDILGYARASIRVTSLAIYLIARPKMATFAQYLAVITQSGPHIERTFLPSVKANRNALWIMENISSLHSSITHVKLWKQSFTIKFMSTDDAGAGTASPLSV
jgi:hypothetical protein